MNAHLKYLWYVLRHKWFVFLAGIKLGVPLLALIIHDWQKFTPAEWNPYVRSFYGPWDFKSRPERVKEEFDRAWLHHQHYGPHHWQHWILREDGGSLKLLEMPNRYRREMLADWAGAGMAINGKDETREWYLRNREKIQLHPSTQKWVEKQLGI